MKKNKEIDLGRMQTLLNGFSGDGSSIDYEKEIWIEEDNISSYKDKDLKNLKINSENDTLNIDFDELKYVLNSRGRVSGFANITHIDNLHEDILSNTNIDDFKNAKSIIFSYIINEKVSFFKISDTIEKISEYILKESNVLLETSISDDLSTSEIAYKILITGIIDDSFEMLKDKKDLDLRYHKQLYNENHSLKNKLADYEFKIKRLTAQKNRLEESLLSLKS